MNRWVRLVPGVLALMWLVLGGAANAQKKNKSEEPGVRSVQGVVRDPSDNLVEGAVVQLKNIKTLQIRSFITQQDGAYHFHGLSPSIDYELKADYKGLSSDVKTLSTFDSRSRAIINLKLEKK